MARGDAEAAVARDAGIVRGGPVPQSHEDEDEDEDEDDAMLRG
ncbi:hypothetical protein [Streptomyces sp. NPDC088196]